MRRILWRVIRSLLFRIDPETAHRVTTAWIRLSMRLGNRPLRLIAGSESPKTSRPSWNALGMEFASPVGLAAGFDKNAEILAALPDLGFGFAEIGTVTPRSQPGNDRPRLFRDPSRESLFNRMGFNGLGATLISSRLATIRPNLPETFRVGVNIGKNKDTPLDQAARDYHDAISPFRDLADYVVVNVSSPNTPGLRSLQTVEGLIPIIETVSGELDRWSKRPPLLLKLAPELHGRELSEIVSSLESRGVSGWVLTNTLAGEIETPRGTLNGGWSGGALRDVSRRSLQEVRAVSSLPIISVGGIMSLEEAKNRLKSGANLIQIYTGWIYRGPGFPLELRKGLP